ncbi:MAG: indole-3-glycerol phosphate synthase TrpC [Deltaproteobacteria bacterium]|nr:indole-3-glycerol phosphate synthase TrpC [Deltaproteobacteria bacterium]
MSKVDILAAIIADKHREVAAAAVNLPLAEVKERAEKAKPALSFLDAIRGHTKPRIIAECKRQSPSRGIMRVDYDPVALAREYAAGGAAAISVLTDEKYFGGHLNHLQTVRAAVTLPLLRKDFIVSEYQIYEARAHGADTFLLLSGPLSPDQLNQFIAIGRSLGMEPLIESHTAAEIAAALSTDGKIFGINNRDLKTFSTNLKGGADLLRDASAKRPDAAFVCESGIKTRADIERMQALGYNVFLIGEALVTHADPRTALATLIA